MLERDGAESDEVRAGPFTDDDFLNLPDTHWTLLVRDVEKQAPDLAMLLEPFRFIPDWRIDGLTISYATPPGTVGPRVNEEDRFLLQGHGRRRWRGRYPAGGNVPWRVCWRMDAGPGVGAGTG